MLRCVHYESSEERGNLHVHIHAFVPDFPEGINLIPAIFLLSSKIATVSLRTLNLNTSAFYGRRQAQYKLARRVFDSTAIASTSPDEKKCKLRALFNFFIMAGKM